MALEKRVLRRIFGPKQDGGTGGWRKLHDLYSLPSIIRMIKLRRMMIWVGNVVGMGEKRNMYRILVGKPEEKRPRCRWIDKVKMDRLEMGLGGMDWIGLAQDRYRWRALVNVIMNLRVP
jgi:hypothetical protein